MKFLSSCRFHSISVFLTGWVCFVSLLSSNASAESVRQELESVKQKRLALLMKVIRLNQNDLSSKNHLKLNKLRARLFQFDEEVRALERKVRHLISFPENAHVNRRNCAPLIGTSVEKWYSVQNLILEWKAHLDEMEIEGLSDHLDKRRGLMALFDHTQNELQELEWTYGKANVYEKVKEKIVMLCDRERRVRSFALIGDLSTRLEDQKCLIVSSLISSPYNMKSRLNRSIPKVERPGTLALYSIINQSLEDREAEGRVCLDALRTVIPFYRNLGFRPIGESNHLILSAENARALVRRAAQE